MKSYSVNALSERLKVDRRTLKKYLAGVKPVAKGAKGPEYALADVQRALAAYRSDKAESGDLKAQKISEEIRKLRLRNDREEGKLVERARVSDSIRRIMGALRQRLEQRLCNEWPTEVAGLDAAAARVAGKRIFDSIMAAGAELGGEWA